MALSGLGPALSGAYANVQRLLLQRKLEGEDLDRRRQEALAERQAQQDWWLRQMMQQRQWATEDQARAAQTPEARLARAMQIGPHVPGGVDIADYLREMGFPVPPRQVEQGVATIGMPPPGMEGLEAPRPGQILPQQRIAFGGVREEPGRVMVGPPKPRRTYGEAFPAEDLKPGWAAMAIPIDAQGNERPDENARVERPKPADILAREKHVLETTETPQKVYKRGYDRVDALAKAARGASTPEEARGAAVAHNTQLAATNRELKRQGLTELPFKPINIQAAMQGVARRTAGGAGDTQAAIKLQLTKMYLAGQPLTPQQERVLFGTAGEEIVSAKDRQILKMWKDNIDSVGTVIDKDLAAQLKPAVDRIAQQLIGPAAPPSGVPGGTGRHLTREDIRRVAVGESKTEAEVERIAIAQGFTVEPAARPSVTGLAENVAQYKRQGKTWPEARILLIRDLVGRGFTPQQAAKIADTQGRGAYNRGR